MRSRLIALGAVAAAARAGRLHGPEGRRRGPAPGAGRRAARRVGRRRLHPLGLRVHRGEDRRHGSPSRPATRSTTRRPAWCRPRTPRRRSSSLSVVDEHHRRRRAVHRGAQPDKATKVKGLGKAGYRLVGKAAGGLGPSIEVGWLSEAEQLQTLRFTFAEGRRPAAVAPTCRSACSPWPKAMDTTDGEGRRQVAVSGRPRRPGTPPRAAAGSCHPTRSMVTRVALLRHGHRRARVDARRVQLPQHARVGLHALADPPHHDAAGQAGERQVALADADLRGAAADRLLVGHAERLEAGDRVAVRRPGRLVEQLVDLLLDRVAHHVLPAAGLLVGLLVGHADDVDQQQLGEPVLAHDRDGGAPALLGQHAGAGRSRRAAGRRAPSGRRSG